MKRNEAMGAARKILRTTFDRVKEVLEEGEQDASRLLFTTEIVGRLKEWKRRRAFWRRWKEPCTQGWGT